MADLLLATVAAAVGAVTVLAAWRALGDAVATRSAADLVPFALVAAAGAAVADGAATGVDVLDVALRVGLAVLVTAGAARARRRGLVVAAGIAAAASPGDALVLAGGFAALGAAVAFAADGRRSRPIGSAIGAVLVNVVLRLSWPDRPLATAAVAGVVVVVVLLAAVPHLRRRTRRRALLVVATAGAAVLLAAAGYGLAAASARDDVTRAVSATDAGLDLARDGDTAGAVVRFEDATARLADVRQALDAWWARPVRYVPVAAQQARAVDELVDTAGDVLDRATEAVRVGDVDRVRPREGRVDLDALATFEQPLADAIAAFEGVRDRLEGVRSPWLVPFLDEQIDTLERRADDAQRDSSSVLDAVRQVPWLLGSDAPRRWFLAVVTPSELRGGGGYMGNWGIVRTEAGDIEMEVFGRHTELTAQAPFDVSVDSEYDARYLERFGPGRFAGNAPSSPNLPSNAEVLADIARSTSLGPIDGVIQVDPLGMAALLELTGPVQVPQWPEPLTATSAPQILLHDQYLVPRPYENDERLGFLDAATQELFRRLTNGELPSPRTIGDVLAPAVAQKRIQVHAFDEEAQQFIRSLGLDGRMKRPIGDGIGLVAHNAAPSKIDWFLRRSLTYDVTVDPETGEASAEVEVRLRNEAPSNLPDNGYLGKADEAGVGGSRLMVSLYTTLGLQELTVDGQPLPPDPSRERGYLVYDRFVDIPPGGEVVMRYRLDGVVRLVDGRYRLDVHRQPTVAPDRLVVRFNGDVLFDGEHDRDLVLDASP